MTDFIREVEEEYRRDKAIEAWKRYQNWIIGLAILIVAAAGGWRFYQSQQKAAAEAAGAKFESAIQLAREGKPQDAEQAFLDIARSGPRGYAILARFRAADEIASRNRAEAVVIYDALANDPGVSPVMQNVARLRAAFLVVDTADEAEIKKRIEPLAAPTSAFRHSARELLGLAALKAGDFEATGRWFDMIVADPQAPQSMRDRAGTMLGLVAAGPLK
ncbi:MAG: tetratricopeptide repeat protein [Beijerinckiaceae bacterium]